MKKLDAALIALTVAPLGFSAATAADWQASGSLAMTHQSTNTPDIRDEGIARANLFFRRGVETGAWLVHAEGGTTPRASAVSSVLSAVNANSGTALDRHGEGCIQLSELYYADTSDPTRVLSLGYLDISGLFDQSRIASDEVTQFLGVSFKGNPVIEFPDYTVGAVLEQNLQSGPVWRVGLTSSNGLANNHDRSYSQLLSVRKDGKGVFAISSLSWASEGRVLRLGAWTNTADHAALDGGASGLANYGGYLVADYQQGRQAINLRLGLANDKVSRASAFAGLGYQFKQGAYVLGAGAARAFLSTQEPNKALGDTVHYEVYLSRALTQHLFLTGDLQHVFNSNFGSSVATRNRGITVYGLRLTLLYE